MVCPFIFYFLHREAPKSISKITPRYCILKIAWKIIIRRNDLEQHLSRIRLVKEALSIFEKDSGAKCIFKDAESGGSL